MAAAAAAAPTPSPSWASSQADSRDSPRRSGGTAAAAAADGGGGDVLDAIAATAHGKNQAATRAVLEAAAGQPPVGDCEPLWWRLRASG